MDGHGIKRKLSLSSIKFFLAGKGLSFRTGKYFGESILVGLVTGFVVVVFRYMIDKAADLLMEGLGHHRFLSTIPDGTVMRQMFSKDALLDPHRWLMVVLPACGALVGYMLIRKFAILY